MRKLSPRASQTSGRQAVSGHQASKSVRLTQCLPPAVGRGRRNEVAVEGEGMDVKDEAKHGNLIC